MCPGWWGKASLSCGRNAVNCSASREVELSLRSIHSSVPVYSGTVPLTPRVGMFPSHMGIKEERCECLVLVFLFCFFWWGAGREKKKPLKLSEKNGGMFSLLDLGNLIEQGASREQSWRLLCLQGNVSAEIPECSELEGTCKGHRVQLLSEWPIQGSDHTLALLTPCWPAELISEVFQQALSHLSLLSLSMLEARVPRQDDHRCYLLCGGKTNPLKTNQTWWW